MSVCSCGNDAGIWYSSNMEDVRRLLPQALNAAAGDAAVPSHMLQLLAPAIGDPYSQHYFSAFICTMPISVKI